MSSSRIEPQDSDELREYLEILNRLVAIDEDLSLNWRQFATLFAKPQFSSGELDELRQRQKKLMVASADAETGFREVVPLLRAVPGFRLGTFVREFYEAWDSLLATESKLLPALTDSRRKQREREVRLQSAKSEVAGRNLDMVCAELLCELRDQDYDTRAKASEHFHAFAVAREAAGKPLRMLRNHLLDLIGKGASPADSPFEEPIALEIDDDGAHVQCEGKVYAVTDEEATVLRALKNEHPRAVSSTTMKAEHPLLEGCRIDRVVKKLRKSIPFCRRIESKEGTGYWFNIGGGSGD